MTSARWLALVAPFVAVGCSDAAGPDSRVVGGVDLDVLFAPATASETAAVEAEWASREVAAVDVDVVRDTVITVSGVDLRVRVVSHSVGGVQHYGAILADTTLTGPAPVLVYAHGGDGGVDVDDVLFLVPFLGDIPSEFVWVIPSFRDEPLEFGSESWTSEGPASPWDRDVDDALSLVEAALDVEPAADPTRIVVLGFSRGAGVGLLMGIRDPRIDRVIEFFGPTDFFGPYVQEVTEEALRGEPRDLPGLGFLDESFIQPLARGELTMAQVRSQLVRRSAVLFADRLPALQVHHGTADIVVDVSQAEALIAAMDALGRSEPDFEAWIYEDGTHNPLSLSNSIPRTIAFLEAIR
ncbi:MAG: peptidase [Gemmatimonadetes bacterium]|nr:peptidase [Gemmatimonadota bacterium]